MMRLLRPATALVLALAFSMPAAAQSAASPFRPLDLPAPNDVRTGAGWPGPGYWQQRADYRIEATLDTATATITGRETIAYTNRSPDPLPYLWLQLDGNICAPGSVTKELNQPPLVFGDAVFDFSCRGFEGGFTLDSLALEGRPLEHVVYGTMMRVELPEPLQPGGKLALDVAWRFPVPPFGAARMGHDGAHYEVAQWYPRMAVYDDVSGWNTDPYIGAGEFYLEYGSFDVTLRLPATHVVVATGTLQDPADVLTAAQRERLARARTSAEPVAIITADEAGASSSRPNGGRGWLTWHFQADSVRDFAFAALPRVRWDASSWDGILIQTLYRPEAELWREANRMANQSIRYFSEHWYHYPYPHATTVEGPIDGMEYPMLTFVPAGPTRDDLYWTLAHEFGHEWYPMVVGSNERLYPWMDEGFNTFIDLGAMEDYYRGTPLADTIGGLALRIYPEHAIAGEERPIGLRPVEQPDLFWTAYRKPSLMLSLLREEVLGPDRFDRAFRAYTAAWAFRHPTPADFFRMMEDVSGMDLDWFWRGWIYTAARLDQAVSGVERDGDNHSVVVLENRGDMLMPVEMQVGYADGTTATIKLPVELWNLGPTFRYRLPEGKTPVKVVVDPRGVFPDVDRANNTWTR